MKIIDILKKGWNWFTSGSDMPRRTFIVQEVTNNITKVTKYCVKEKTYTMSGFYYHPIAEFNTKEEAIQLADELNCKQEIITTKTIYSASTNE